MNINELPKTIQRQAKAIAETAGKKIISVGIWDGGMSYNPDNDDFAFDIITDVRDHLKSEGFNIGSMCRDEPMAISKQCTYIAKWRNIDYDEYNKMDGVILCDDRGFRNPKELYTVYFG